MASFILNGADCTRPRQSCILLADILQLPEGGRNLDALHDLICSIGEDTTLAVRDPAALERQLGDYGVRLMRMLSDAAEENPKFKLEIHGEEHSMTIENYREMGLDLEQQLLLRYSPIALKLIYDESEIPEGTVRPWQDEGNRLAMCQAFALVRRNRKSFTLLKEDHWCVWPLVSYRICPLDEADYEYIGTKFFMKDPQRGVKFLKEEYPFLNGKAPIGFSIAPLRSCTFEPDLVCIYCNPAQIRSLLLAAKFDSGEMLKVTLDPVDSCVHSTIPVLNGQDYNITFPDPGEYERGLTDENEVMFTLRGEKLPVLTNTLKMFGSINFGYRGLQMEMDMNFPRPEFYNKMFDKWGLATGAEWKKGK